MGVLYDGKSLIPAPFITFKEVVERSGDGVARSRGFVVTLKGTLCAAKGSPRADGSWWTLAGYPPTDQGALTDAGRLAIMRSKMGAVEQLFAVDGRWLEIQPYDGSAPIKCQPRLVQVEWAEGPWYDTLPYTITLECDCLWFGTTRVCPDDGDGVAPQEEWGLEQADDLGRTYRLTHSVTHASKRRYAADGTVAAEGWQVALDLCVTRLGLRAEMLKAEGVLGLDDYEGFNYVRSQQVDEGQGKVTLTETWLAFDPADNFGDAQAGIAVEDCTIESRYSVETGQWTVAVSGTITGLEQRDEVTRELLVSRFGNATARYAQLSATDGLALARAQTYSGLTLNPRPKARSVGENKKTGVISYSWEFDQRVAPSKPEYLSEVYSVELDRAADVFAAIGVLNRLAGPILQSTGSNTQKSITVDVGIVVRAAYAEPPPAVPNCNTLTVALEYIGIPSQIFVQADHETWVENRGQYSRSSTFVYQ